MAAERDNERGLGLPNKIFSVAVTDLNNITLPYNDRMFRQSNYLNEDERYMIYRGLLLHKHTDGWNERPYKTYSNTLKLIRHGQN